MRETRTTAHGLRLAIERSGYYPALVADAVESALGTEPVLAYVVQHEATFDPTMEVRRHVTLLVLSQNRLILCHTDEHLATAETPRPHASTLTESVPLGRIQSVRVTRVVPDPASYAPGVPPTETLLTISWGVLGSVDLEPATCGDEACEVDHGFQGTVTADDPSLRVSDAADGAQAVSEGPGLSPGRRLRPPKIAVCAAYALCAKQRVVLRRLTVLPGWIHGFCRIFVDLVERLFHHMLRVEDDNDERGLVGVLADEHWVGRVRRVEDEVVELEPEPQLVLTAPQGRRERRFRP